MKPEIIRNCCRKQIAQAKVKQRKETMKLVNTVNIMDSVKIVNLVKIVMK